jgi:excisionase family DNA binding protein
MSETPWLTSGDVAARLGVSSETIRRWAVQGLIPHMRTPKGHLRFTDSDVMAIYVRGDLRTPNDPSIVA